MSKDPHKVSWPTDAEGNALPLLGFSPVTDAEAIERARQMGAEIVVYFPETKTAYIPKVMR